MWPDPRQTDRDSGAHEVVGALPGEMPDRRVGPPDRRRAVPGSRRPVEERRIAILAEGDFAHTNAKTAHGLIRYGHDQVVAVIDSSMAGGTAAHVLGNQDRFFDIPIVATLFDALALPEPPNELVVGIAPVGGKLPDSWRDVIHRALRLGIDVVAGLHTFLADDPELAAAARAGGSSIVDLRRPPERMECAVGRPHASGKRVILTVGSDSAVGKMTASLELAAAANVAGLNAAMVPTGQTGMLIEGWGVTVDRVAADFLQGTVEWLVEQGEQRADWLIVEGQGSIDHPAYSSVALGLLHGAQPDAMVLVHELGRMYHDEFEGNERARIKPLPELVRMHEELAALVRPAPVVAISLNSGRSMSADEARRLIAAIEADTGLPTDDPFRFGAARLWAAVQAAVEQSTPGAPPADGPEAAASAEREAPAEHTEPR